MHDASRPDASVFKDNIISPERGNIGYPLQALLRLIYLDFITMSSIILCVVAVLGCYRRVAEAGIDSTDAAWVPPKP